MLADAIEACKLKLCSKDDPFTFTFRSPTAQELIDRPSIRLKRVEAEEDTLGHEIRSLNMERTLKFVGLYCNHPHNVTILFSDRDKPLRIRIFMLTCHVVTSGFTQQPCI